MGITQWSAVAILGTAAKLGDAGKGGQQPQTPKLDVAKVTAPSHVTGGAKTGVTIDMTVLKRLTVQRATGGAQMGQMRGNLSEVFQDLATRLTPEQRVTLRQALRGANGPAGWGGHMGYMMGSPGYAGERWGNNGGMGSSMMGNGGMGWGMRGNGMGWGGHMGRGYMGGRGPGGSR